MPAVVIRQSEHLSVDSGRPIGQHSTSEAPTMLKSAKMGKDSWLDEDGDKEEENSGVLRKTSQLRPHAKL